MKFRFKPGDRVRIKLSNKKNPGLRGTIASGGFLAHVLGDPMRALWIVYNVNWDDGTNNECGREFWLEPIYDGNLKVSWSCCAWRPDARLTVAVKEALSIPGFRESFSKP